MNNGKQIAILGLGKMGGALAQAALRSGFDVIGFDIDSSAIQTLLSAQPHLKTATSLEELLAEKIPLLLAVKPGQAKALAATISDERLIISIAAGVSIADIQNNRLTKGPVIRAMPNTPLVVGQGMTVLCASADCSVHDKDFALSLFAPAGECLFIDDEKLMHVVTGLSGSGPAYVYLFLQALEDAGVHGGLPRPLARKMALQTVAGAAEVCRVSGRSPQDLIHDVTSPGGTTIAGLAVLKEEKLEAAVHKAVAAATQQSEKLGN